MNKILLFLIMLYGRLFYAQILGVDVLRPRITTTYENVNFNNQKFNTQLANISAVFTLKSKLDAHISIGDVIKGDYFKSIKPKVHLVMGNARLSFRSFQYQNMYAPKKSEIDLYRIGISGLHLKPKFNLLIWSASMQNSILHKEAIGAMGFLGNVKLKNPLFIKIYGVAGGYTNNKGFLIPVVGFNKFFIPQLCALQVVFPAQAKGMFWFNKKNRFDLGIASNHFFTFYNNQNSMYKNNVLYNDSFKYDYISQLSFRYFIGYQYRHSQKLRISFAGGFQTPSIINIKTDNLSYKNEQYSLYSMQPFVQCTLSASLGKGLLDASIFDFGF